MVKAMVQRGKRKILYYETLGEQGVVHLVVDAHFQLYLALRQVIPGICITFSTVVDRDMYAEKHWKVITPSRARFDEVEGNEPCKLAKPGEVALINVVYHHG